MNETNWRRGRTIRALELARCLVHGHHWAPHAPDSCVLCAAKRGGYDPATPENVLDQLELAIGPWPPSNNAETC